MNLVVNDTWQKMFTLKVNFFHSFFHTYISVNSFYPALLNKNISIINFAFVYYGYIFKKVVLHDLKIINKKPIRMQIIKCFFRLLAFILPVFSFAQTTYL